MNRPFLRGISILALTMLSLSVNADSAEDFQTRCTEAWMKHAEEAKDKVDFKNFGEKYCSCAAKQPLDNEAAFQKAAKLCMSRTLLHDAMDSIEDDIGLSKAKDSDVADYCQDRWDLVLPKPTDEDKKLITAYCECAKPKLVELLKKSNDMTDKQYYSEIDDVADTCADSAVASKPSSAS
ncbi:hypothetical protein [Legionella parisiensis]|uniref:Uncharacterized protein n=1 Tax=Legionella parisiensis TaxID=45071 RepID=A0A1E5JQP3_9GAMM|nr:hypothetical protein [Legionella parisiensis]KTD40222.1 hypothetical protein Lpar_1539 [Legionella parisiensis]OEH46770.1 hypothetical protein lpari_02238 [Legionella parisiensis]STX77666.1 Uncharacterised protein [Legionella parisiensis]